MRNFSTRIWALVIAISCHAIFVLAAQAQVQDDVIVDGEPDLQVQEQRIFVQDEAFDQWLYGSYGTAFDVTERFTAQLDVQLADIERICAMHDVKLSEAQVKKLRLAARGDIERFQERVDKARAKFDEVKTDQNRINEVFQDIQPLQAKLQAGLFGEGSLFEKAVTKVLAEDQQGPRMELQAERRKFRYRGQIGVALAIMENGLPLLSDQREQLVTLLVEETEPPKRFSQYDYYYVLLQVSKIPQDKVRAILDETQWKMLQPYLTQAKGMEQFLNQQEQQLGNDVFIFQGIPQF